MASNITSVSKREKVISLWSSGYQNKETCSRIHLSHQTVSNILSKFLQNGTAAPGKPGRKERTQSLLQRWLPAVEIQRYASNCNYTVNLLHSRFGIDNFNILEGPSNGFEMIHFFEESLQAVDHVGNPVLANGDVIVMDNCGFRHGVFAENQLHEAAS